MNERTLAMLLVCIGFPAVMAILALLARRYIGCICKCGRRTIRFNELDEAEKSEVLGYFRNFEKREPDTTGLFVCRVCELVYDDFSGGKKSLQSNNRSMCKVCGHSLTKLPVTFLGNYVSMPGYADVYSKFVLNNQQYVAKIECLRCKRRPICEADCVVCNTNPKAQGCPTCFTLFTWTNIGPSKFKYLVPLTLNQLQNKSVDPTFGWV